MKRNSKKTDVGVIVGRFQVPYLHEGHIDLIQGVCNEHSKVVIALGLSPCLGTRNNPMDFEIRKKMILQRFPDVICLYITDIPDDKAWSKNLDKLILDICPNQTVTLYGGRDSFIQHYTGKFSTEERLLERFVSGTEIRREAANSCKDSADFRAGVIWGVHYQYPRCLPTIDVAIFNEDYTKILLARKPNEKKYRFIGGFADPASPSYEVDVRREVAEEAHIEIGDIEYVGSAVIDDWRYRNEIDKIKTMLFAAKHIFGRPEADDDIAEVRWFDIHNDFEPDDCHDRFLANLVDEHHVLYNLMCEKAVFRNNSKKRKAGKSGTSEIDAETRKKVLEEEYFRNLQPTGNSGYDKDVASQPYIISKKNPTDKAQV